MAAAYTQQETEKLVEMYLKNPTWEGVEECAKYFKRTPRSIVAKLSKEGVYTKTGYVDKQGRRPVTKLQLVTNIENMLGVSLPDLDKAPKETLRKLLEEISELSDFAGKVGKQLLNEAENEEIRRQMRIVGSGRGPG